jgi:epoxyqueuosine reductase
MDLAEQVKHQALALGFDLVAVTTPDPPQTFETYVRWIEQERHGEMGYLASEKAFSRRANPRLILPDCISILVLGMRYARPAQPPKTAAEGDRPHGRVAAYAWGEDYHTVLVERMQNLHHWLETKVGNPVPVRWYTDTGPILERDLAQRAGLGWIGKNTCLIRPGLGSYFFLAELLLGLELTPDPPFMSDYCGSCRRCIEACPTACILPDRTLDARRCISYLTIELKGAIPVELRPKMGEWVFGCDICQQVCPWNIRFAPAAAEPAFGPRPELPRPDMISELDLDAKAFNRKFKDSPVKRAKRRGYLRNVAIALGNAVDPAALQPLAHCLVNDPEPLVRAHAAWALGCYMEDRAFKALQQALESEQDPDVRQEIFRALRRFD